MDVFKSPQILIRRDLRTPYVGKDSKDHQDYDFVPFILHTKSSYVHNVFHNFPLKLADFQVISDKYVRLNRSLARGHHSIHA